MFQHITLFRVYINVKQWSVNIMKSPYDVHFPTYTHSYCLQKG